MDGNAAGREQAHLVRRTIEAAGIDLGQLWLHYFSIGGSVGELEVEAFLHDSLTLPTLQRDLLAHAANELLDAPEAQRIPQSSDLLDHDDSKRSEQDQHGAEDEDSTDEP